MLHAFTPLSYIYYFPTLVRSFVFLLKASKQSQMWGHGISIRGDWRAGWWTGRQLDAHVSSYNSNTYTKLQFAASYFILQLVTLKLFFSGVSLSFSGSPLLTSPPSVQYLHPLLHWNCINIWKHDFITTYRDILFPLLRFSSTYFSMIT